VNRSAIILATGIYDESGQDLSTMELDSKPLIQHVIDKMSGLTEETIVVVESDKEAEKYSGLVDAEAKYVVDDSVTDLGNAIAGFKNAQSKLSILLAYNMPFISTEIVDLLFELCHSKSAVVPRWPDQHIEPIHSVYNTSVALKAAQIVVEEESTNLSNIFDCMSGVRYMSTLALQELDPDLKTFFQVQSPLDLRRAKIMIKPKPKRRK
jgi:molybdopterin-guanine dinucleotide biosynthesis protein A